MHFGEPGKSKLLLPGVSVGARILRIGLYNCPLLLDFKCSKKNMKHNQHIINTITFVGYVKNLMYHSSKSQF